MADAPDLGSGGEILRGSSPLPGRCRSGRCTFTEYLSHFAEGSGGVRGEAVFSGKRPWQFSQRTFIKDLMYEHRTQPLLSLAKFTKRVVHHLILALLVLAVGLGIGILGYHFLAELNWVDSLLNASMILGGMGPVDPLHSSTAKYSPPVTPYFRASFYRHSLPDRGPVCASPFAPHSSR